MTVEMVASPGRWGEGIFQVPLKTALLCREEPRLPPGEPHRSRNVWYVRQPSCACLVCA